jgi:hypothetical protein
MIIKMRQDKENTLLSQFKTNDQCVYYGIIDNKSNDGERLIKFGMSNDLCLRVKDHKKTYTNFYLTGAYKVLNKTQIENAIKKHPLLIPEIRKIKIKDDYYTELISINFISVDEINTIIKEIIKENEYNIENYIRLINRNNYLEKRIIDYEEKIKGLEKVNNIEKTEIIEEVIKK